MRIGRHHCITISELLKGVSWIVDGKTELRSFLTGQLSFKSSNGIDISI